MRGDLAGVRHDVDERLRDPVPPLAEVELHRPLGGREDRVEDHEEHREPGEGEASACNRRAPKRDLGGADREETQGSGDEREVLATEHHEDHRREERARGPSVQRLARPSQRQRRERPGMHLERRDVPEVRLEHPRRGNRHGPPRPVAPIRHSRERPDGRTDRGGLAHEQDLRRRSRQRAEEPERREHRRHVQPDDVGPDDRIPEAPVRPAPSHPRVEREIERLVMERREPERAEHAHPRRAEDRDRRDGRTRPTQHGRERIATAPRSACRVRYSPPVPVSWRGLYAIVDPDACSGRDPEAVAQAILRGGCAVLQLRAKRMDDAPLLALARRIAARCAPAGVPFVVNDRPDLAMLAGADGVHLGQRDVSVADARRILGDPDDFAIGLSTHDDRELASGLASGADLLAFGPIFPTRSKIDPAPTVGVDGLERACARSALPVVAIGGITVDTARAARAAGAALVAAISALASADNPERAARAMNEALA